jgi:hypothetical protein
MQVKSFVKNMFQGRSLTLSIPGDLRSGPEAHVQTPTTNQSEIIELFRSELRGKQFVSNTDVCQVQAAKNSPK